MLPLLNKNLSSAFCSSRTILNDPQRFKIFFLQGNDPRPLNYNQQIQIAQMINQQSLKTSTYVYNSFQTKRKYRTWLNIFPWIKPHYAVKANSVLPLLQDLIDEDSNFDCASRSQIQLLLKLGVDPKKIVYSNTTKDEFDLEWAGKNSVQLTVSDSLQELIKIKKYAPNMKILWRISINQEQNDLLTSPFSEKFGDDIQSTEKIESRMKEIQQLGIRLSGIHFHCGSGNHGASTFEKAVLNARQCIKIGRQYGHSMQILDIGGGFPAGQISQKTIDALKITQNDPLDYKVISEPGLHFASNSFYVLTKVIGKKIKNNRTCYHLNESIFHMFHGVLINYMNFEGKTQFSSAIDSQTLQISETGEKEISSLFGMTCCGFDIIAKNAFIPKDMNTGDWLCVAGMGAYTYELKTEFNGMKSIQKIINWSAQIGKDSIL